MRITATVTIPGRIDLSALERLHEDNPIEREPFHASIGVGESIIVDDKYYTLINIQRALQLEWITIYDYSGQSAFSQEISEPESKTDNYDLTKVEIWNRSDYPQDAFRKYNANLDIIDANLGGSVSTDEKVKYDENDPAAGYLSDKVIAGSGISVAEGVGADENKLVITNTDKGSDVDLSGLLPDSHLTDFVHGDISHTNRTDLDNVSGTNTGDQVGDGVTITGAGTIADPFVAAGGGSADEKVKYDVNDPTAGYIVDKIIAGSGISIAEGTGANENKLEIINTDKGSDVDLSGLLPDSHLTDFVHGDIAHTNRSDLDNVSGTNTGDSSGHANLLPDSHLTDFVHSDIAHANRSDLDNVSGTNTGDSSGHANLLPDSHLTDFVHSDIAHANRSDLDLVSGTNTGDSSGHSNLLPDSHLTDFTHGDIAHANRSDLDNVSGTNTGDQVGDGVTITGSGVALDPFVAVQPDLSGFVPYTGATGDVDLGVHGLTATDLTTDSLQFDLAANVTVAEGELAWNATDGTLDLGMPDNVTQQIGQELFIKVHNKSGATITNGSPVYFDGRQGNRPKIWLAKADSETTCCVEGITTNDIEDKHEGFITTFGYVRQIKTNYIGCGIWGGTWEEGDKLYV
jgi:hypothetical protein